MANGMTTHGDISRSDNVHLQVPFLEAGKAQLTTELFGVASNIPKGEGVVANWAAMEPFDPTPNILVEGITPTPKKMKLRKVEATLQQLGDLVEWSDQVDDTVDAKDNPVLQEGSKSMGLSASEMLELYRLGFLKAGTHVYFANGVSRAEVNTVISRDLTRKVVQMLEGARAPKITEVIRSTPSYGTKSVPKSYVAWAPTILRNDIEDCVGFKPTEDYGSGYDLYPSEIGSVGPVRFLLNDMLQGWPSVGATPTPGGQLPEVMSGDGVHADVFPVMIFGAKSYGIVSHRLYKAKAMDGKTINSVPVSMYFHSAGKADKSDPIGQRGYMGWKTWQAAAILTDSWFWRIECACKK